MGVKEPITSTLRELGINETAVFPLERLGSVVNIINRLRIELARQGWRCIYKKNLDTFEIEVKRVA